MEIWESSLLSYKLNFVSDENFGDAPARGSDQNCKKPKLEFFNSNYLNAGMGIA